MKTFLAGLACGVLLSIAAITYLEFTQESTGGFTSYVQPLLSQLNEVIPTESNVSHGATNVTALAGEDATVLRVVDGDTIDIEINGERQRVRYIGMNTPERGEPCFDEATQANVDLALGKAVHLVSDVSETDRYGRLLRYVYVGDVFVNLELVAQGYAEAVCIDLMIGTMSC